MSEMIRARSAGNLAVAWKLNVSCLLSPMPSTSKNYGNRKLGDIWRKTLVRAGSHSRKRASFRNERDSPTIPYGVSIKWHLFQFGFADTDLEFEI
jgi:hypothetical protein